jgi:UDP-glucose 4-epimerase
MKIMVTGSRGFIGQAVGHEAARRGDTVLGLSRSAQAAPGWPGGHRCIDVVDDDVSDIVTAFAPDAIIHAAGPSSVGQSFETPVAGLRASLMSWANVLDAVRRSRVSAKAVLLSSAAIYGQPAELPVPESALTHPMSPYGYTKAMAEMLGNQYTSCFALDVVACRLFSVIGPAQRRLLLWDVYRQLIDVGTDEVVLRGSRNSSRDYLHVQDAAAAIVSLCHLTSTPGVVNIASGERSTVGEVAAALRDAAASTKPVRFLEQRTTGDPDHWQGDITALTGLLPDWQPRALDAAIADCVAHWSFS